ncbi:MAG: cyclic nucleotide-binding domain-containing protein [Pyrinomonadaceae bacterium]|nr:cyclic nucleotide-binding domain-containing protein [Pyrinomonadaceae bacterium]
MAEVNYEPGALVFKKGDESLFAYLIQSGEIEILDGYPDAPVRLALLKEGAIFGEMGLIDERPRNFTARAVTAAQIRSIDRAGFVELIKSDPDEAFRYLRMFFERLRAMNVRFVHSKEKKKDIRVAKTNYKVRMFPDSKTAESYVPSAGLVIESFPYRVGRASKHDPLDVNDLTLTDKVPYNVSRNHFSIEKTDQGVYIHDRGSFVGTIVNGDIIGGHHRDAWTALNEGINEVVAGSRTSAFRFRVEVTEG